MNLKIDLNDLSIAKLLEKFKPKADSTSDEASSASGKVQPAPRVNLMPPKYAQLVKDSYVMRASLTSVGVGALVIAGAWGLTQGTGASVKAELEGARQTNAQLTERVAALAPVTNLARQTESLTETVERQSQDLVPHDAVIERFVELTAGRLDVTAITLTSGTDGTGACRSTDGFNDVPLLACVQFNGDAAGGRDGVAAVLSALSSDPWFTDAYVPNITDADTEDAKLSISGEVGVTASAVTSLSAPEAEGVVSQEDSQ
ncbi:hypothetical protein V5R04_06720 [Jonesiaceae bacterium BS-20]|uniref:Uncharacterized protein n=1 Tax=Jonesiaceae bacterium BS-20 TaxID=3120821 RepID=A0AAU7DZG1_9MICO